MTPTSLDNERIMLKIKTCGNGRSMMALHSVEDE
jgi:hypothetical protein